MEISIRVALCLFVVLCLHCNGDELIDRRALKKEKVDKNVDLNLIKTHFPLKDGDNVFFWRLQKVGSSTMLSILMSYSYRYNFLPRRKGSNNSQCRRIGQCALENAEQHKLPRNETSKLKKFVESKTPGSTKSALPITQTIMNTEALTASIPFKISLGHELCNLEEKHVRNNLACSFSNPDWSSEFKQVPDVKEIFMVRDPVSRAISVYYFWGELFKLAKVNKDMQEADRIREHAKQISDSQNSVEVSPHSVTKVVSSKRSREASEDANDDNTRSAKKSNSNSNNNKSSTGDVVISVRGKLAETPHTKRDDARMMSNRKKDIRQFGRLLNEEDPEVLEEVERLLVEDEYFADYYHSPAYLDQIAAAAEVEVRAPFKRSHRQLAAVEETGGSSKPKPKLGTAKLNQTVDGKMFVYHGDESTVPPIELAMGYASNLPFTAGKCITESCCWINLWFTFRYARSFSVVQRLLEQANRCSEDCQVRSYGDGSGRETR